MAAAWSLYRKIVRPLRFAPLTALAFLDDVDDSPAVAVSSGLP